MVFKALFVHVTFRTVRLNAHKYVRFFRHDFSIGDIYVHAIDDTTF